MTRPVVLCVLDGWGYREDTNQNAIAQANTPHWDRLWKEYPHGLIEASERHVGLPCGQMGNSEVGHMNIGAGRVVLQDLPRIDRAVETGELAAHPDITHAIATLKKSGGTLHLMGLLSDGGVHAHLNHIIALANLFAMADVPVRIHAFLDGRDTPPKSANAYMQTLLDGLCDKPIVSVGTVSGRYYAMDRDKRWDRVSLAYDAMVHGKGQTAGNALNAIEASYAADKTDEFVLPTVVGGYAGMQDGDGLLMANFRADRAREILTALVDEQFNDFPTRRIAWAVKLGMVEYSSALAPLMTSVFGPQTLPNGLGEVVAAHGLKQLRIAETEKYAHVTFFFNGGREEPFEGEERILVPSPKVATYDLQPEMSAPEVTDKLVAAIESDRFDLLVVNYANTDMVGHSGDLNAAKAAVEAVDACLGRLEDALNKAGGAMLITADHGNAEQMFDETTHQAHTAHTLNLVPSVLVGPAYAGKASSMDLGRGVLADVAPTILALMGIAQPKEMDGQALLEVAHAA